MPSVGPSLPAYYKSFGRGRGLRCKRELTRRWGCPSVPLAARILKVIAFLSSARYCVRTIFLKAERPTVPRALKPILAAPSPALYPRNLFVGSSGWAYPSWKPGFYPKDVPSRSFLQFYASRLTSVEVNYSFRTLPSAIQLQGWLNATSPGFRFSFKAPQRITHFQRLRDSRAAVGEFVTSLKRVRTAGKLGVLLFQLPPNFPADNARLEAFLKAPALARNRSLQVAFEFRHPSWFNEETYEILRRSNRALCIAEGDELKTPDVSTADFCCYRLRRSGGYSAPKLKAFAKRFEQIAQKSDVYVYFKHEDEPTGALNATKVLAAASKVDGGGRA
jgi:uncharacterized protein YecE (DUF72 family)